MMTGADLLALAGSRDFFATDIPGDTDAAVAAIIADVRARGDAAVLEYTQRFDRLAAAGA